MSSMDIFLFPVRPKPRTFPMTVINKTMKTRLQSIDRRVRGHSANSTNTDGLEMQPSEQLFQTTDNWRKKRLHVLKQSIKIAAEFI